MKRTRQINPGFFTNDELADITPLGRLLFAGLWVIADREGRLEDRPKKIKAEILPYDNCDVDDLLNQLQNAGFIKRYKVDIPRTDQGNTMDTPKADVGIIQVVNFTKYQHPHRNESASTLPPPTAESRMESGSAEVESQGQVMGIPRTDQGNTMDTPRMPSSLYLVSSNSESNNNSLTCINNKQTENGKQVNQQHTLAENEFAECIKYYQKRIHPFTGIVEREFVATLIQDYGEKLFKQGVDITASNASYKGAKIWRYLAAVLKRLKEKPDRTAGNNAFDDVLDEIIGGDDNA
ncbi:hypothetical protein M3079_02545 [Phascolarctobacterium sp. ET69]|uniref:hypothetical protein n=1 Tax=Phascolarctobacterium sp. ET69 TaxID=2939420 RepID=UPI002011D685|nr:hypothetical protein [Phascolarctobacterium sp. ET69]MCL1604864.1 hypothetical protein [Phascolarctobacterium sp. ET69]